MRIIKLYAVGPDHVLLLDYNGPNNLSIKKITTPWINRDPEAVLGTYIVMSSGNLLVNCGEVLVIRIQYKTKAWA